MKKLKLEILGISYSQAQTGAYALILGEVGGKRRLPIIIGGFEAQAIAIELEKMKPSRPLTHDLFKNFAIAYNISVTEVIINKFSNGVFHAVLVCFNGSGVKEIDSRTSDAVALAVRFKCPIFTYEKIMSEAGVIIDEEAGAEAEKGQNVKETPQGVSDELADFSLKELRAMLKAAVEAEEYEKASKIRDEIERRKGKSS